MNWMINATAVVHTTPARTSLESASSSMGNVVKGASAANARAATAEAADALITTRRRSREVSDVQPLTPSHPESSNKTPEAAQNIQENTILS
jgi:hypothetical protein